MEFGIFLDATTAQETTASKTPAELVYDVVTFSRKFAPDPSLQASSAILSYVFILQAKFFDKNSNIYIYILTLSQIKTSQIESCLFHFVLPFLSPLVCFSVLILFCRHL